MGKTNNATLPLTKAKAMIPDYTQYGLNNKELKFIAIYLINGFNGTQAYIDAGFPSKSRPSAGVQSHELLKKDKFRPVIRAHMDAFLAEARSTLEHRIVDELMLQAFYDPADFIDSHGNPRFKSMDELSPEQRRCVQSIETKYYGKDADRSATVIKLVDRNRALNELGKYIDLMKEHSPRKVEVTGKDDGPIQHSFDPGKLSDVELQAVISQAAIAHPA